MFVWIQFFLLMKKMTKARGKNEKMDADITKR